MNMTHLAETGNGDHVTAGTAIAFTAIAGLATAIGGAVVFLPQFSNNQNTKLLSGGLAMGGGAIAYLAFEHMLEASHTSFQDAAAQENNSNNLAALWSNLCLFSGILLMYLLSALTDKISPHSCDTTPSSCADSTAKENTKPSETEPSSEDEESGSSGSSADGSEDILFVDERQRHDFWRTGIATALALVLHNIPVGILIYFGAVRDNVVGAALAIGIALHSFPEGSSVAIPIYFATGNKLKAFLFSVVVGLAPVVGGVVAYAISVTCDFGDAAIGVTYGFATGMLFYIALKHMLRAAYKHDPEDKVTTTCFILGMFLIAVAFVVMEVTGTHEHGGHATSGGGQMMQADMPAETTHATHHGHI